MGGIFRLGIGLTAAFAAGFANPAAAHPHVWITGQEQVIFTPGGEIAAIRHAWVFDAMYSAFVTEGVGKKGQILSKDDLAPLARSNIEDLAEFEYFTHAKLQNVKVEFGAPTDYSLEERPDKLVVLRFTMPLKAPAAAKLFAFQVYDPTYFVAFDLDRENGVSFVNAPKGCSNNIAGAKPLAAAESSKLSESFFTGLSPGADFGVKLASSVIVACP
jgi:ABC-type uncharacterized transport system substrate-binding protein